MFICDEYSEKNNKPIHVVLFNLSANYLVKANEMGRACGTHGRGENIVQGFGGKARRK
jgi:hypothetical protein